MIHAASKPYSGMLALFTRFILRPISQRPGRTCLTLAGVMLGVAVMVAIQLANRSSLNGFSTALEAVSGRASLELVAPPLGVDESLLPGLSWLREYGIAAPVVEADVMLHTGQGRETMRVIGIDVLRDPALRDYAFAGQAGEAGDGNASGIQLLRLLSKPDTAVMTQSLAARHGLKQGDVVTVQTGDRKRSLEITAIVGGEPSAEQKNSNSQSYGASALAAQSLAILDISQAQSLLDRSGRLDRLELRLRPGLDVAVTEQEVRQKLPPGVLVQRPQRRTEAVEKMLAAFHFNLTMLSSIALLVGLFLIYNTVSVAVMTRRREVGMLRTLGVSRRQVLGLFLGEAALLGLAGALLGVPLARVLAQGAVGLTATTVDTLYVAAAAQVPSLGWLHWAAALAVAIPLSLAAAWVPALEATRISPVEAMRSEVDSQALHAAGGLGGLSLRGPWWALVCFAMAWGAALLPAAGGLPLWGYVSCLAALGGVCLLVPWVLGGVAHLLRAALGRVFGVEGRLAAAQIRASTRRLTVSVAALAVSLSLTVAIAVMVASFRETVLLWVGQTLGADLYVRPGVSPRGQGAPSLSEETLALLRNHAAVTALEGYRSMELPYGDRAIKLGTGDFDLQSRRGRVALKTGGDAATVLPGALARGEVLVSESFTLRFGKKEGDEVELNTREGPRSFRIAAQFYDYSSDAGTVLMDKSLFARWFGEARPTHVALYLMPGTNADGVRDELLKKLNEGAADAAGKGASFVTIFTNAGLRGEVLRIFDSTFAITWALEIIAVFVAMGGIAATMMTLVLERSQEIRLLRLAGAGAGQIRRTIIIESGLLGAVSQLLGLVAGLLLSLVLISVINPQSFGWSIRFHAPWGLLAGAAVLTVLGTVLAGLWPARSAIPRLGAAGAVGLLLLAGGMNAPKLHAQAEPATSEAKTGLTKRNAEGWAAAEPGYSYSFPRDHGQHPQHKIEWWYFTGNLRGVGKASGRRFGYQLTFFRIGVAATPQIAGPWALRDVWMAHLALTDANGKTYHHADRLNRAGPGLAGAKPERIWNEDWSCDVLPSSGGFWLKAVDAEAGFGLELKVKEGKPAIIHGQAGISAKGPSAGNASHYYSFTRMPSEGTVKVGGETFEVAGDSWMDHEFGTSFLEPGTAGWDWFSIQLSDGSELMLFQIRPQKGGQVAAGVASKAGTWIQADGRVITLAPEDLVLTAKPGGAVWRSQEGAEYPLEWQLEVPKHGLRLRATAVLPNQEFRTQTMPGLHYWEGAMDYEGQVNGAAVTGQGYLEMTGYSGQSMSRWFGVEPADPTN